MPATRKINFTFNLLFRRLPDPASPRVQPTVEAVKRQPSFARKAIFLFWTDSISVEKIQKAASHCAPAGKAIVNFSPQDTELFET